ncbi:MAG: hypothetical protein KME03_08875 [Aphanocapsa lilacina HA4352-LM1]|nr:hypothetical protein [Aphanocapsa lilacina HA4352-LM1]
MVRRGGLIVFEGPDGVGKTTLAQAFCDRLRASGEDAECMSFPGREYGTLGAHVYGLHHEPQHYGVRAIPPLSKQLLHVASHCDAIENRIVPALESGKMVILDRYWWSTWVYGSASGVTVDNLKRLIAIEETVWRGHFPKAVVLVFRCSPFRAEQPRTEWQRLLMGYERLAEQQAEQQKDRFDVLTLVNEGTVEQATTAVGLYLDYLDHGKLRLPKTTCAEGLSAF